MALALVLVPMSAGGTGSLARLPVSAGGTGTITYECQWDWHCCGVDVI